MRVDKLIEELTDNNCTVGMNYHNEAKAIEIIKKHFRDVHDEAVAATVMANNKKHFVKPQYND